MQARQIVVGIAAVLMAGAATPVFGSEQSCSQNSAIDKIGDWWATMGKSDTDKQMILADRCTKRVLRHTQHELEESNREARKQIHHALGN